MKQVSGKTAGAEHDLSLEDSLTGRRTEQIKGLRVSRVGPAESLGLTLHDTEVKDE